MSHRSTLARSILARFPSVTTREADILAAVGQGWDNATVAATLGLTERTVKNVLVTIPPKVGVAPGGSVRVRLSLLVHGIPVDASPVTATGGTDD